MRKNANTILKLIVSGFILCIVLSFVYNKIPSAKRYIGEKMGKAVMKNVFNIKNKDKSGKWAKDIPVLMYHHLLRDDENPYKDNGAVLPVETFQEHMGLLHKNGYYTIGLNELERFVKGEINLPERSVLITFDDGYKSNYEYAYPILKGYGFKAAIFLISSWNTDEVVSFDAGDLQYLSWNEIENSKDVFEYASHTHDLHKLDENGQGYLVTRPLDEIEQDLETSMKILDTAYLAYPYGHYNKQTLKILKKLGYRMAFTVKPGRVRPGNSLLELNRYAIFPGISREDFERMIGL
ncbi:MAG: polysaccharide deacetylase family protein [Natronincolaceae bacterium]|mgnify:CR=1 FL=1|jgi:peptidoglycan/xylan/chitin deacetylase (PgdA/CDA1 family)|nr:polysaccharide deacetylase family protein [Bacillota bacterium]